MQLTISPEYDGLVPNLSKIDYSNLYQSIKENGLWIPILCNSEGVILDGHHRYDICNELGIQTKHAVRTFENALLEKKFVIECNLKRRHLTDFQKSELGMSLQQINEKLAHENSLANLKQNVSTPPNGGLGSSMSVTADKIGVKPRTYERCKKIIDDGTEEQKNLVRTGDRTISSMYNQIVGAERVQEQETIELPTEKFQLIYTDPPWKYWAGGMKNAARHYSCMGSDDLQSLAVNEMAADDSVILMWATFPTLPEAFELLKVWGFNYSTVAFTWVKKNKSGDGWFFGTGNYTRANAEICLLGVKGKGLTVKSRSVRQICDAPVGEHSVKPDEIRDRIVELFGNVKRIEMFARINAEGWKSWGNEL